MHLALQALLEEKHITRAAVRISLSQPAMSRVLGRLRAAITARTGHCLLFVHMSLNRAKELQQLFRCRSRRSRVLTRHQFAVHLDVGGPVGGFAVDATPFL